MPQRARRPDSRNGRRRRRLVKPAYPSIRVPKFGALVIVQLTLLSAASTWIVGRFRYRTLYRLELDGGQIRDRSSLRFTCRR